MTTEEPEDPNDRSWLRPAKPAPISAKARRRTWLVVVAPLVSVATLMIGLRVGAGSTVQAAAVFAAPPGRPATLGEPLPRAWQVLTYLEDRGVRETVGMQRLTLVARAKGHEARWTGDSNADGIAEATFSLPGAGPDDPIDVEILREGEPAPLASGTVAPEAPLAPWGRAGREPASAGVDLAVASARPSKRTGAVGLDLLVEGGRLVVGFETPVWVHARLEPTELARAELKAEPEPGLVLGNEPKLGCEGWAELGATAQAHVVGLQIDVAAGERKGGWYGAVPVAAGAFFTSLPRFIPENRAEAAVLIAPNPRNVVYAEVDDEHGRVFAAALTVATEPSDPTPRAHLVMPPLAPGLHWLVASGEPRGAERLLGAAIAKPFLVGREPGVRETEACSLGPWLAGRPAAGFPRVLAVDGMATRGASNRLRYRIGMVIGLVSLLAAAILEVLLLTAASRESRALLLLAELDGGADSAKEGITARAPGGGLAIALLVALLGFALLAALIVAKA